MSPDLIVWPVAALLVAGFVALALWLTERPARVIPTSTVGHPIERRPAAAARPRPPRPSWYDLYHQAASTDQLIEQARRMLTAA